jgi:hypothetical protein
MRKNFKNQGVRKRGMDVKSNFFAMTIAKIGHHIIMTAKRKKIKGKILQEFHKIRENYALAIVDLILFFINAPRTSQSCR